MQSARLELVVEEPKDPGGRSNQRYGTVLYFTVGFTISAMTVTPLPKFTRFLFLSTYIGFPSYTPTGYSDDLPPPPPPSNGYNSYSDPLPPPPPELSSGSGYQDQPLPPPPATIMHTYNEPHPASYRQQPAPAPAQNQVR